MKRAVIIFTRVPVAGRTKTRMEPSLTPSQCEKLHTCFLRDIRRECERCRADIYVCYTPDDNIMRAKIERILGSRRFYFPQKGDGLGERMYRALKYVLGRGYESCILIGTDVPELDVSCLTRAFDVLKEKDVVFGKTEDGGYYLTGMKRPVREVFNLDCYGHGSVLKDTVKKLKEAGITAGYTKSLADMDEYEDLKKLRDRVRKDKRLQRTYTARYISQLSSISVIVPVYNEEKSIVSLQEQLEPLKGQCEIIFADGGSTDRTPELIRPEYKVIHTKKGRAFQMNAAARVSSGDILFFLHCDSELPDNPLDEIREVMRRRRAGCFGIAFHSRNFFMFTCRVISNHRVKDRKVMFGDQGIFIDRELFFEAGMFPEIPLMEDYQFSLILKSMKVKLGMAGKRIYTSDRRFPKGTIPKLKLMWKMNRLRKMYRSGVPADEISAMYRDIR